MTIKKPICIYSGKLKELQAGDNIQMPLPEIANSLAANYTMSANSNAIICAPYSIAPAINLSIPPTSRLVIVT